MKAVCKYSLLLTIILLFTTGCSTTTKLIVQPEILRFDTPETSGGFLNGSIDTHIVTSTPKYDFARTSDTDFFIFDINNTVSISEKVEQSSYLGFGLNLGIIERIDVFKRSEGMTGIKVQVLGSPRLKREEGWKLSLSLGRGDYSHVETRDLLFIFPTDRDYRLSTYSTSIDASINAGYRYNSSMLVYFNIFKNKTDATGFFQQNATTLLRKDRTHDAKGGLLGINLMKENKSTFVTFEVGYAQSTWSTLGTKTYTPAGVSIGYMW